jgi:CHAT domain-containing protein
MADRRQILERIRSTSSRYGALTQPQPLSVEDIQKLLDPQTVLLEFALGDERSFVWAMTSTTLAAFQLPPRGEIEEAAHRVRELIARSNRTRDIDRQYAEAARALSRMILEPAATAMNRRRFLIVADGILQYLPLGALPAPARAQSASDNAALLVSEHEIVVLPSASVLGAIRRDLVRREPASKTVAVLADPVFDSTDSRLKRPASPAARAVPAESPASNTAFRSIQRAARDAGLISTDEAFPRLPSTRLEAQAILRLTTPALSFQALDFNANRAAVTSPDLRQYRIVHIAAHGILDSVHPELSGLVLSLVDDQGAPQDGFLRLHDIYNLDLPVDLVVLSACQTGLGKDVRGEGIVGLTRGFMYAGAARVVVSLWKVDDEATSALMRRFYEGMLGQQHLSAAAALRAAQMDLAEVSRWRSPYYWAGFVLHGEPR